MKPSPEAVAWGKRQASKSPRWNDAKWTKIETIFGVDLLAEEESSQRVEVASEAASLRDAA